MKERFIFANSFRGFSSRLAGSMVEGHGREKLLSLWQLESRAGEQYQGERDQGPVSTQGHIYVTCSDITQACAPLICWIAAKTMKATSLTITKKQEGKPYIFAVDLSDYELMS